MQTVSFQKVGREGNTQRKELPHQHPCVPLPQSQWDAVLGKTRRKEERLPAERLNTAATSSPLSPRGHEPCPLTPTARCASCRRTPGSGSAISSSGRTTLKRRQRSNGPSWSVTPDFYFLFFFPNQKAVARLQSRDSDETQKLDEAKTSSGRDRIKFVFSLDAVTRNRNQQKITTYVGHAVYQPDVF